MKFRFVVIFCCLLTFNSFSFAEANPRIIDGEIAPEGIYPSVVSFAGKTGRNKFAHGCGATIINKRYLLTAAHCVLGPDYALVGSQDIRKGRLFNPVEISAYVYHPGYSHSEAKHDIAILRLSSEVVQPLVSLPGLDEDPTDSFDRAVIVGWGRISERKRKKISLRLKHGGVNLISKQECIAKLKVAKQSFDISFSEINDNLVCGKVNREALSSFESSSPCNGDSGSPMFVQTEKGLVQVGIASFIVPECGKNLSFFAYTRVQPYLDWIDRVINEGEGILSIAESFRTALREVVKNSTIKRKKKRKTSFRENKSLVSALANFEIQTENLISILPKVPSDLFKKLHLVTATEINTLKDEVTEKSERGFRNKRVRKKVIDSFQAKAVLLLFFDLDSFFRDLN
ncbi:MAG: serine protease [Bdellovibrionota bacterium]